MATLCSPAILAVLARPSSSTRSCRIGPSDVLSSIGMIAGTPNFLVVRKDFPAKTLSEFIAHAKANPGRVTIGNAGFGSNAHLVCLS